MAHYMTGAQITRAKDAQNTNKAIPQAKTNKPTTTKGDRQESNHRAPQFGKPVVGGRNPASRKVAVRGNRADAQGGLKTAAGKPSFSRDTHAQKTGRLLPKKNIKVKKPLNLLARKGQGIRIKL